jgi:hypothetical protein
MPQVLMQVARMKEPLAHAFTTVLGTTARISAILTATRFTLSIAAICFNYESHCLMNADTMNNTWLTITDDHHSQSSMPSFVFRFEISASDIAQISLHNAPINPD